MTKDLDFSLADRKAELLRWLSEDGRFAPDTGGVCTENLNPNVVVMKSAQDGVRNYGADR